MRSPQMEELIKAGVIDPTEEPFDEAENIPPEIKAKEKGIELPEEVKLQYPIRLGEQRFETLTFSRPPKASEAMALPMGGFQWGHFVPIIAGCCGVSVQVIKELATPDFQRLLYLVTHFLFRDHLGIDE